MYETGIVELAQENPDRTVFWGTVNPLEGRKALETMEVQVKEYGAKAFKFYSVRYDYGQPCGLCFVEERGDISPLTKFMRLPSTSYPSYREPPSIIR